MTLSQNPANIRAWRARSQPLGRTQPLTRTGFTVRAPRAAPGGDAAAVIKFPERKTPQARDTIPPAVRRLVGRRDMAEHIHHRRLKGMGGTSDDHADCPCNLVSLTFEAHEFMHRNRFVAVAEGLIVPASAPLPGLLPVRVHSHEDDSGAWAWPTCDGRWIDCEPEPDGNGAA